ncbi:hypothetical protein KVV02_001643 [Mortierella alpina]|uniref:DNA 3'-5' helicase n=1 Tax=Mortierella alpina TaxID=64518 RepID=A0A9P8A9Q3_MORAP|nr:hypothetical protein KVV02_001643 [Mortierella alpina]
MDHDDDPAPGYSHAASPSTGRGMRAQAHRQPAVEPNPFLDDNPFLVRSSPSTRTARSRSRQTTPPRRLQDDDDNNPFLSTHKFVQTHNQAAIPQTVEYGDVSLQDIDIQHHHSEPFPTTPKRRPNAGASSSLLLSPSSSRHTDQGLQSLDHAAQKVRSSKSRRSEATSGYQHASIEDLKLARKELKAWEASFKATHSRAATQDDIARDEVMIKKYRAYGKLKKALDAKASQEPSRTSLASTSVDRGVYVSQPESAKHKELLRTPTKQSRTSYLPELPRTPTRKQEFVSPHKIVNSAGLMSPSRKSKSGDDRHQFLSSLTPKSQRTRMLLMSPSRSGRRKSPHPSPSSLFTVSEHAEGAEGMFGEGVPSQESSRPVATHSDNPFLVEASSSQSRLQRTPTSNRTSSHFVRSPFMSPSRSRTSPFFGGMNNMRPKRVPRPVAPPQWEDDGDDSPSQTQDLSQPLELSPSQKLSQQQQAQAQAFSQSQESLRPMGLMSPTRPRRVSTQMSPATPSRQQRLTLSQRSPGCVTPEADFWVIPAGFHSHNRRRGVRQSLVMPSQEEAAQFEREFNLAPGPRQRTNEPAYDDDGVTTHQSLERVAARNADGERDGGEGEDGTPGEGDAWEDQGVIQEDDSPFGPSRRAAPKKKYTQKRTTRLHKIVVAPSEKAEAEKLKKTTTRSRKTTKATKATKAVKAAEIEATDDHDDYEEAADMDAPALAEQTCTSVEKLTTVSIDTTIQAPTDTPSTAKKPSAAEKPLGIGWANSNKPLIKSDRWIPGVGQGRAGAKKSTPRRFGGPSSDGNFVAYNLQRGAFRKGGARGKSRFGGSKSAAMTTGRTAFDADSWRAEYDKDFDDTTLLMSLEDGGLEVEDEDGDDMPWYGNVNDITDPCVVTISRKYLRAEVGEENDPEEYVKALELQNGPDANDSGHPTEFRVNLEYILKKVWGYPSFRDGQLESIKRILRYESSLLVLPTGSGKSLSYQLPAYIFSKLGIPSLTLVISPMISLMYDQVKHLPPGLSGACWTSVEQTTAQFKDFMEKLTSNTLKILFISPEKLQSQSFLSLVRSRRIPRIPFLCVDEVHCLSEWSHNFRPAYLLMNHVLKTDLKSPCVLGLTGTATEGTKDSICAMLDIDRTMGVLSGAVIRENLAMTVSLEVDREPALVNLLQSPKFAGMGSILIYVMKQAQADALAAFLRVRNFSAESYHAGKSTQDRQRIQQRFMNESGQKSGAAGKLGSGSSAVGSSGGIRILVATIAFGLGLNKSNIRSVIHYCMPKSLENYIQEIGRSGRDGEKAFCHMFLNQDDYLRLRSLAYADGMDWACLLRLIKKLFSRRDLKDSTVSSSTRSVKSGGKKRHGTTDTDDEDQDADDASHEDSKQRAGTKKRKQNDQRSISVKAKANSHGSKQQNIVLSTRSILVIPPPPVDSSRTMVVETGIPSQNQRLVVVREELIEEEFDIKKEVLATLLSYIELDESRPIKVLGSISAKCTVKFLYTAEALSELVEKTPLMETIMAQGVMTGYNSGGGGGSSYGKGRRGNKTGFAGTTLSMAYCCDSMSLCQQSGLSFTELVQELQLWKRKKWVMFEMTDPALCVEILKEAADCMVDIRQRQQREIRSDNDVDMSPSHSNHAPAELGVESERDQDDSKYEDNHDAFMIDLTDRLYRKLCAVERVGVAKVDQVYELFQSVATATWQQQEVFKPRIQEVDDEVEEDADSSEYDEDVDAEYIEMRARAKAKVRRSSSHGVGEVTEAEIILRQGIQEYFAKCSGEGIGGPHAEEDLFRGHAAGQEQDDHQDAANHPVRLADKSMQLYSYENAIVTNLQRKWRSAVEVDLKVFLSQQWQLQQQQQTSDSSAKLVDTPRSVSRIFHGIQSPCFSALEWSRTRYWGKYFHFDFAQLMLMADRITKEQRQQRRAQQQQ